MSMPRIIPASDPVINLKVLVLFLNPNSWVAGSIKKGNVRIIVRISNDFMFRNINNPVIKENKNPIVINK